MTASRQSTRRSVLRRDGAACRYCGRRVYVDAPEAHPWRLTYDHVWPEEAGGSNGIHNLVACCRECNATKLSKLPHEGWWPMPPPDPTPTFRPWSEQGSDEVIVSLDRGRIRLPFLSKAQMEDMNSQKEQGEQMQELRLHTMAPYDLTVDG